METKEITITDLALLKSMVELCSTRGAFKAEEMSQVGQVYDKLTAFLDAVVAQAKAQEETAATKPQGE
jgi:hypothetical protein